MPAAGTPEPLRLALVTGGGGAEEKQWGWGCWKDGAGQRPCELSRKAGQGGGAAVMRGAGSCEESPSLQAPGAGEGALVVMVEERGHGGVWHLAALPFPRP